MISKEREGEIEKREKRRGLAHPRNETRETLISPLRRLITSVISQSVVREEEEEEEGDFSASRLISYCGVRTGDETEQLLSSWPDAYLYNMADVPQYKCCPFNRRWK